MNISKILFVSIVLCLFGLNINAADLTIRVTGIVSEKGTVRVALHDGSEGFPRDRQMVAGKSIKASTDGVTILFNDLVPGVYAISAFQDIDGDKKLSTNLIGLPTEPFGFSNDARGSFGPPDFEDAAFNIQDDDLFLTFKIGK